MCVLFLAHLPGGRWERGKIYGIFQAGDGRRKRIFLQNFYIGEDFVIFLFWQFFLAKNRFFSVFPRKMAKKTEHFWPMRDGRSIENYPISRWEMGDSDPCPLLFI